MSQNGKKPKREIPLADILSGTYDGCDPTVGKAVEWRVQACTRPDGTPASSCQAGGDAIVGQQDMSVDVDMYRPGNANGPGGVAATMIPMPKIEMAELEGAAHRHFEFGRGAATVSQPSFGHSWFQFLFRYLHILAGVMWIGLLWYFNFVQIPTMPKIPDELKPAIGKHIAPAALWWFRWGAMATIVTGVILAAMNGYLVDAIALGFTDGGNSTAIGIGMWMGTIMWFNVWFVIWPNQKKALGIVEASADEKAAAARTAMLFSRTNTMLSIPMLYCMVAQQHGGFV